MVNEGEAGIESDITSSLWTSFKRRNFDEINALLRRCREVDENNKSLNEVISNSRDEQGYSFLHWAAQIGHNEFCLYCIEQLEMDVDVRVEPTMQTPLMLASVEENLLTMHILMDKGADVSSKDDLGDNPLTLAAQHEKLLSCLLLLSRNVEKDIANVTGCTAAHWAAFSGAYLLLSVLDAAGCNMKTSYDHYGLLPLHRALQLEFYATARMMIDFDKDLLSVRTKDGLSLEEFAKKSELSKQWFDDFLKLCQDPHHKVKTSKTKVLGTDSAVDDKIGDLLTANSANWFSFLSQGIFHIRPLIWSKFVDLLVFLEESRWGRRVVPLIAYFFALTFFYAWKLKLSSVNLSILSLLSSINTYRSSTNYYILRLLIQWIGIPIFGYIIPAVLRLAPLIALMSILLFTFLLILDPGEIPKTKDRRPLFKTYQDLLNKPSFIWQLYGSELNPDHILLANWLYTKGNMNKEEVEMYAQERDWRRKAAVNSIDARRICPTCWIQKGLRTKHCSVCNSCCEVMDHHCVWLNRCVGRRNNRLFVLFIAMGFIGQVHQILLLVILLGLSIYDLITGQSLTSICSGFTGLILTAAASFHFLTCNWGVTLLYSQGKNIWEGITTNETLSTGRYKHFIVSFEYPEEGCSSDDDDNNNNVNNNVNNDRHPDSNAENLDMKQLQERDFNDVAIENNVEIIEASGKKEILKKTEMMTRKFIRNPFVLDDTPIQNCWNFWRGTVNENIDYKRLEEYDKEYIRSTKANISSTRRAKRTSTANQTTNHIYQCLSQWFTLPSQSHYKTD